MEDNKKKSLAIWSMIIIISMLGFLVFTTTRELDRIRNELTARDAQIQEMDVKLGLARSSLLELSQLNDKYKDEIDSFPDKLKGIIDSYNLKLMSRDKTIAMLKNTVSGGKTNVIVQSGDADKKATDIKEQLKISYEWSDELSRFHLIDPDIFAQNDERFTYSQHVAVTGHVFYGKDGRLQIRRMELHEVVPDGTDDAGKPKFKDVEGSSMEIVDSKFEYADIAKKERRLIDILHPRLIASVSTQMNVPTFNTIIRPGIGIEIINLGRYIDHANLGLNIQAFPNIEDIRGGSLLRTGIGVGIAYTLLPPLFNTNIGLGLSASTPSNNLLNEWRFNVDAILYATN
jgi:hypothetical protein